jgi:hypothetical protein
MATKADIPFAPLNQVTSTEIDYLTLYTTAEQGPEPPYPMYEFAEGRKRFMSNMQGEGVYGKPVQMVGDETIHLPDPDLNPTQN